MLYKIQRGNILKTSYLREENLNQLNRSFNLF